MLTHAEAVRRVVDTWEMFDEIRFDLHLVVAGDDGEHVAVVYQSPMTLKDGTELSIGSMEIFRVVDGRITEVWNCGYKQGVWRDRVQADPRWTTGCSTNSVTTCWPEPVGRVRRH